MVDKKMKSVFRDFWMISKPMKSIYENQDMYRNEQFTDVEQIKIYEVPENRHYGFSKKSGIFFEMSSKACEEIQRSQSEIDYQIDNDIKTQLDIMAQTGIFSKNIIQREYHYIDKLNLNICNICNLRCKYCFADSGTYGRDEVFMTEKTAKRAIDSFINQLPEAVDANIVLFGGEPLINMSLAYWIIAYADQEAEKKAIRVIYDIFTNGTLLNDKIYELLEKNNNVRILLSLDGPADINDNFRIGIGEETVTEIIENNLKYLRPFMDRRVVVRCTVGWEKEDLLDRIEYFVQTGFRNIVIDPAYCIDMPEIDDTNEILASIIRQLPKISEYLVREFKKGNKVNINLISEMISQILRNGIGEVNYEIPQCPGGRGYAAIDSLGEIYPCHYFVGNIEYSYGNVINDEIIQKNMIIDNGKRNLEKKNDIFCRNCELAVICEGPCPYKSIVLYPEDLSVRQLHCGYIRKRVEVSINVISKFYNDKNMPYEHSWNILFSKVRINNESVYN